MPPPPLLKVSIFPSSSIIFLRSFSIARSKVPSDAAWSNVSSKSKITTNCEFSNKRFASKTDLLGISKPKKYDSDSDFNVDDASSSSFFFFFFSLSSSSSSS